MPEDGQRKRENGDVGNDVPRSVDVPLRLTWDALRLDGLVPEALDGEALKGGDEELGGRPGPDDDCGNGVDSAHTWDGHDAVVLAEERELDGEEGDIVENKGDVKHLQRFRVSQPVRAIAATCLRPREVLLTCKYSVMSAGVRRTMCLPSPCVVTIF